MSCPETKLFEIRNETNPTIQECIERASHLVDSKFGIIEKVELESLEPGEPKVYFSRAYPPKVNPLNNKPSINFGDAVSTNRDRAIIKSIGECVERYCSALIDETSLVQDSHANLGESAISLEQLKYFLPKQFESENFPFQQINSDTCLHWVECVSLVDQSIKLIPAQFVFLPYPIEKMNEPRLKDQISTGMACAPKKEAAIYKGILEIIERDAFMITWLNQIKSPKLDLTSVEDSLVLELLSELRKLPVTFDAYLLTLDIPVYVILLVVENNSGKPPYTVMGLGADLDPIRSLILALEEALLTFIGMGRFSRAEPDFEVPEDYKNITSPTKHAMAHAVSLPLKKGLEFLRESKGRTSFDSLPNRSSANVEENISFLVGCIKSEGLNTFFYDMTTEDIDDVGFKVTRVIIPGMQPLDINHSQRHLGVDRLHDVPKALGLETDQINPYPHAFP